MDQARITRRVERLSTHVLEFDQRLEFILQHFRGLEGRYLGLILVVGLLRNQLHVLAMFVDPE